MLACLLCS